MHLKDKRYILKDIKLVEKDKKCALKDIKYI